MKTAIVYYSQSGHTARAAEEIAGRLGADLIPVRPVRAYPEKGFRKFFRGGAAAVMKRRPALQPYAFDAGAYGLVILGTPVWAGRMAPPMRTFLSENREALRDRSLAVFACSGGGPADKAFDGMKDLLGVSGWAVEPVLFTESENRKQSGAADGFCAALSDKFDSKTEE